MMFSFYEENFYCFCQAVGGPNSPRLPYSSFMASDFLGYPDDSKAVCSTCKSWFTFNSPLLLVSDLLVPTQHENTYLWWTLDFNFCLPCPKGTVKPLHYLFLITISHYLLVCYFQKDDFIFCSAFQLPSMGRFV